MDSNKIIVLIYLAAWVITFLFYYRKNKKFDSGCFIMATYIVYALSSYLLYNTKYIVFSPLPLKVFPFIYLFLMLLVGLLPILRFRTASNVTIQQPSMSLLNVFCCIFIFSTLIHFPSAIVDVADGFSKIMYSSTGGMELYEETLDANADAGHSISNLAAVVSNAFAQVGFLLTIYYLTLDNKSRWVTIGLFISCLMKMLNGVATGQRGAIVEPLLVMAATFFLLKDYMKPVYKKIALRIGVVLVILLSIPVAFITISRFDNSVSDPLESTYYYLGVENINFNNYALDDNGIRYGDRTVPLFKRMVGFKNVPKNFFERREKYPHLKINDNSFITYVGDIAIDYGPYSTVIIIIVLSLLFVRTTKIRNKEYKFHQLLLVHFWLYLCVIGGVKLFPYADTGGNLKIIVMIISYFIFKNDCYKHKRSISYAQ